MANTEQNQQRSGSKRSGSKDTTSLSPRERHALWTASKIERAGQDDVNVISSKTKNLSDFVNLLNIQDKLSSDVLLSFGSNPRVTVEFLEKTRLQIETAKEAINTINANMCAVMNWEYRPPRGFKNPLHTGKPQAQQPQAKTSAQSEQPSAVKKAKKKKKVQAAKPAGQTGASAVESAPAALLDIPVISTVAVEMTSITA